MMKEIILECIKELYKLSLSELEAFNVEWQRELDRTGAKPEVKKLCGIMVKAVIERKAQRGSREKQ
jgi:hypothetical protein